MVGGGIFALAGVAFAVSGPSALLAFVINGIIVLITAFSFAEMAAANPQSGGMYTFAKKALTVQVAFGVGWVIWFASIVASLLYSVGFAAFTVIALQQINWPFIQAFVNGDAALVILSIAAIVFYTFRNVVSKSTGGSFINIAKIAVFVIIIAAGFGALFTTPEIRVTEQLRPFFTGGLSGFAMAMGYTFIALQGFGLIANVSGEIKDPQKNIPKSMFATIFIGLLIYLPLLFIVMTVGVPAGENITEMSVDHPETVVAVAVQNFMGPFGFWLVIFAGIFSMLSALQANLFSASRVAFSMAQDRTLSHQLSQTHRNYGTPVFAVLATSAIAIVLVLILPNVASAGAASGLIFLLTYAIAHLLVIILRKRSSGESTTFRAPFFPYLPIFGMVFAVSLAVFQAVAEPIAGAITLAWLATGTGLFLVLFEKRARVVDAYSEGLDPDLIRLRGLSPTVLVPTSNPQNSQSMVFVANALIPQEVGKVLLLSIVRSDLESEHITERIKSTQEGIQEALSISIKTGYRPDALTTIADDAWNEIARVARVHHCQSIVLGLSNLESTYTTENLEKLVSQVHCDVVVFRQPHTGWQATEARKILIPVAGNSFHDTLRARILGSLSRISNPQITFLHIVPEETSDMQIKKNSRNLKLFGNSVVSGTPDYKIIKSNDAKSTLITEAETHDLVIMGLGRPDKNQKVFSRFVTDFASSTSTALIIISRGK